MPHQGRTEDGQAVGLPTRSSSKCCLAAATHWSTVQHKVRRLFGRIISCCEGCLGCSVVLQAVPWVPPADEPSEPQAFQPLAAAEQREQAAPRPDAEKASFQVREQAHQFRSAVLLGSTLTCRAFFSSMPLAISTHTLHGLVLDGYFSGSLACRLIPFPLLFLLPFSATLTCTGKSARPGAAAAG